jgi:hypothetical protein
VLIARPSVTIEHLQSTHGPRYTKSHLDDVSWAANAPETIARSERHQISRRKELVSIIVHHSNIYPQ